MLVYAAWPFEGPQSGLLMRLLHVDVVVASGRLGGGKGILVVDESLHGRRRERERRGQGQAFVVHVVYARPASLAVSRGEGPSRRSDGLTAASY